MEERERARESERERESFDMENKGVRCVLAL